MTAMPTLAQRAVEIAQAGEAVANAPVPSPCVSVCRMNPGSGLCDGCLRTLDEIATWGSLDDGARRAVWQRIGQRALQQSPAG